MGTHDATERPAYADRLRELRVARGWSQRRLALECGLSDKVISKAEVGKPVLLSTLAAMAEALGAELIVMVEEGPRSPLAARERRAIARLGDILPDLPGEHLDTLEALLTLWGSRLGQPQR